MTQALLAIDTATPACSVALLANGRRYQQLQREARQHTALILTLIDGVLQEAAVAKGQLTGILCSVGPGAFTGLRVGAAVAQGLAAALNCPLLPVSALALLARTAQAQTGKRRILALLDARMGELYAGLYEDGRPLLPEILAKELPSEYLQAELAALSGDFYAPPLARAVLLPEAQYAFDLPADHWQGAGEALNLHYLRNNIV